MSKALDQVAYVLAIGLGTGLSPIAPGTVGSVLGLVTATLLFQIGQIGWWLLPAFALLASVLGIWICDIAAERIGHDDPGSIVWDEIAGVSIACCGWLFIHPPGSRWSFDWNLDWNGPWTAIALSFTLFRVLDILKPWPIKWLDQNIHGGLGIMADDLLAGLVSAIAVAALWRLIGGV